MQNLNKKTEKKIAIVGAGLTGSLLALFLGQQGIKVSVYDKRGDVRKLQSSKKRSLGMSLSTRGRLALKNAKILEELEPTTVAKYGRATHSLNGDVKFQLYGDGTQYLSTVNRKIVNDLLVNGAIETGMVDFCFHHKLESIDLENKKIGFVVPETEDIKTVEYDYVFGADGANSNLAKLLKEKKILNREQRIVNHNFKEMSIPETADGEFAFDSKYVHIWSSDDVVFVALPNIDKTFVSTMFIKNNEGSHLVNLKERDEVENYFSTYFPHLYKNSPEMVNDYMNNPICSISEVKCSHWNYKNEVLLIGDSAHAFAPFYAMGMNTCFEDCQIFSNALKANEFDIGKAILEFSQKRKVDVDAMKFLTNRHYHNLQHSKDTSFDIKWKLERKLWSLYPDLLIPEYYEVAFSHTPFSEVLATSQKNQEIIEEVYYLYLALLNENSELDIKSFAGMKEVREIIVMETSSYNN